MELLHRTNGMRERETSHTNQRAGQRAQFSPTQSNSARGAAYLGRREDDRGGDGEEGQVPTIRARAAGRLKEIGDR
jgi:hypothetical protein